MTTQSHSDSLLAQDIFTLVLDHMSDLRADVQAGVLNWQAFEYEAITEALDIVLNTSREYDLIDESNAADGSDYTTMIFQGELHLLLRECPTPVLCGDRGPYKLAMAKFRRSQGIRPESFRGVR